MVRTVKPYQRPDTYRKGNPDAPGSWKHDLHSAVNQSLASRIGKNSSSSSGPSSRSSLANRISGGQGKELLPASSLNTRLHGFDGPPPANMNNANAGIELLPVSGKRPKNSGRGVNNQSKDQLNAALGTGAQRVRDRPSREQMRGQPSQHTVSIMGAAKGNTWVRVENLAVGTTAEDVESAFAPLVILNAKSTPPVNHNTVTVDLELENKADAEGLIKQYHGVVADGNTLSVTIINQGLKNRMGASSTTTTNASAIAPVQQYEGRTSNAGRELLGSNSSGKLYSDQVLASHPSSSIMTLSDEPLFTQSPEAAATVQRSDAWRRNAPSLASRMGGRY